MCHLQPHESQQPCTHLHTHTQQNTPPPQQTVSLWNGSTTTQAVEIAYNKGKGGFWGGLGARVRPGQRVETFDRFLKRTVDVQDSGVVV